MKVIVDIAKTTYTTMEIEVDDKFDKLDAGEYIIPWEKEKALSNELTDLVKEAIDKQISDCDFTDILGIYKDNGSYLFEP